MSYLTFVVLIVPALIGLAGAAALGPNRGGILAAGLMLIAVFVMLIFQVSPPPETGPGSEASRMGYAFGLMRFEWYRWVPSFLVGMAVGSLIFRARQPQAG